MVMPPTGGGYGPDLAGDITGLLTTFLGRPIPDAQARLALRIGDGWLLGATGITRWPDPLPDQLFTWRVELAACSAVNAEGLLARTVGAQTKQWALTRRAEILTEARTSTSSVLAAAPAGCFPEPAAWPA